MMPKVENRRLNPEIYEKIVTRFNDLRSESHHDEDLSKDDCEVASIVIAANSSNPHEAMREYARKQRKNTKWEPGYFRRHQAQESPPRDYSIHFTRITDPSDNISPTLSSLGLSKVDVSSLDATTPNCSLQTRQSRNRRRTLTPKDLLREKQLANAKQAVERQNNNGSASADSVENFSPELASTPYREVRKRKSAFAVNVPTAASTLITEQNDVEPVVSSTDEVANKNKSAVPATVETALAEINKTLRSNDNHEPESTQDEIPPSNPQQIVVLANLPNGNNENSAVVIERTPTIQPRPPMWARQKPLTPINIVTAPMVCQATKTPAKTPIRQASKIPLATNRNTPAPAKTPSTIARDVRQNHQEDVIVLATTKPNSDPQPSTSNQPQQTVVPNITFNLTVNNSQPPQSIQKSNVVNSTEIQQQNEVENRKSDQISRQRVNTPYPENGNDNDNLLTDDNDERSPQTAPVYNDNVGTPKMQHRSSSKRQLFIESHDADVDKSVHDTQQRNRRTISDSEIALHRNNQTQLIVQRCDVTYDAVKSGPTGSSTFDISKKPNGTYDIVTENNATSIASMTSPQRIIESVANVSMQSHQSEILDLDDIDARPLIDERQPIQMRSPLRESLSNLGNSFDSVDAEIARITGLPPTPLLQQGNNGNSSESESDSSIGNHLIVDDQELFEISDEHQDNIESPDRRLNINRNDPKWNPTIILTPCKTSKLIRLRPRKTKDTEASRIRASESFNHVLPPFPFQNDEVIEDRSPSVGQRELKERMSIYNNSQTLKQTQSPKSKNPRKRKSRKSPGLIVVEEVIKNIEKRTSDSSVRGSRKLYSGASQTDEIEAEIENNQTQRQSIASVSSLTNVSNASTMQNNEQSRNEPNVSNDTVFKRPVSLPKRKKDSSKSKQSLVSVSTVSQNSTSDDGGEDGDEIIATATIERANIGNTSNLNMEKDHDEMEESTISLQPSTSNLTKKPTTKPKGRKKKDPVIDSEHLDNSSAENATPGLRRSARPTMESIREKMRNQQQDVNAIMKAILSSGTSNKNKYGSSKPKISKQKTTRSKPTSPKESSKKRKPPKNNESETLTTYSNNDDGEPPAKRKRIKHSSHSSKDKPAVDDQEDQVDIREIEFRHSDWFKRLLNMNIKDLRSRNHQDYDICHVETSKGNIEITQIDKMHFVEADGIDYGFDPSNSKREIGYLRFRPRAVKSSAVNDRLVDFHVLVGKFNFTRSADSEILRAADFIQIQKDDEYSISNTTDSEGIIQFSYR